MEETVDLYFDGVMKTCTTSIDRNGEILCEAEDGSFTKFPNDANFEDNVAFYNQHNSRVPEIIPEVTYGPVITFDSEGNPIE